METIPGKISWLPTCFSSWTVISFFSAWTCKYGTLKLEDENSYGRKLYWDYLSPKENLSQEDNTLELSEATEIWTSGFCSLSQKGDEVFEGEGVIDWGW